MQQRRQRQQPRKKGNNNMRNNNIQRETRPVRIVGAPVTQSAPPRIPAPILYKEPKYFDTSGVAVAMSSSGFFLSLTSTTNGTTDITRIGDQVELHSMEFRYSVSVADATNIMRLVIFQWNADDTTDTPSFSKLMVSGSQTWNSPFNHDNSSKLTILYDKVLTLATYYPVKHESFLLPLDRQPVRKILKYAAGSTTGNNMIYMYAVSDSTATTHPFIDYYARVNFYDC